MDALRYLPFARRILAHDGPPVHLTVFVTARCNLRCRHCFHWKAVAGGAAGPALADLERLADSAASLGPLLWTSFGGGEPFLRDDLDRIAHAFARHGLRHLAIPTNGLLPERMERFVEAVLPAHDDLFLSISVSIDGPPDVHDAIRDAPGCHARALDGMRALKRLAGRHPRLGVGVIVCVTAENQTVLADHVEELARAIAPDHVTVNLARGTALDPRLLAVDPARYAEVVARTRALRAEGVLPAYDFPLARLMVARDELLHEHVERVARRDPDRPHLPCTAARLSAVVYEDGRLAPCEVLGEELGNLNDVGWDLGRLWGGERAEALRRSIRETRCECTWECAQSDNVLFRARSWPRLVARAARV